MNNHLYGGRLSRLAWFVRRFGAREVVMKPLRIAFAPLIIELLPRKTFVFDGKSLEYFYHRYNASWATERCIEVPIVNDLIRRYQGRRLLEIGNVLSHFDRVSHDVVDKFEEGDHVINEDIVTFSPAEKYDLIVSISTLEHIGFDDETSEPSGVKIRAAIANARALLTEGGRLVITVPIGYNPDVDRMIARDELGYDLASFWKRTGMSEWQTVSKEDAMQCRYRKPFPYANAILVAQFRSE